MGQLALVSKLGHQSHMRTFGDITAAMGASVHESHPDTIHSGQTSTDTGVLCGRRRQTSPSLGSRSVAGVVTPLSFPLLRGPCCVPFQYQSYGFQGGNIVGRTLYRGVHMHHIPADVSTRQSILRSAFFISMVSLQWNTVHTVPNSLVDRTSMQPWWLNLGTRIQLTADFY